MLKPRAGTNEIEHSRKISCELDGRWGGAQTQLLVVSLHTSRAAAAAGGRSSACAEPARQISDLPSHPRLPKPVTMSLNLGYLYIHSDSSWVSESFSQFKLALSRVNTNT